ncbi:C45 family peptidase [Microlunatus soli]|uniref:Secernin n=1 Tax=Microlunatus soli TaxID=630515 RepID=A0A1H1ZCV8_9ACTN|nr:hypothetical protein [Microlunatus soli]SDT31625.1 secernin [Microlunatus soli]
MSEHRTVPESPDPDPARRPWSCDTFVALPDATRDGRLLFGKNSDRPARETQPVRRFPARQGNGVLQLAYCRIDDAVPTFEHLGSGPYWCWGHEIGLNSRGVVIGNEALFTRDLASTAQADRTAIATGVTRPSPGLLGMELLRLGLERGGSAEEAVEVIIGLLRRYGQWAAGTISTDRAAAAYDNSYVVADADRAFLLETSGRDWAIRRVETGIAALSNQPTIRTDWSRLADGLIERAESLGWPGRDRADSSVQDCAGPDVWDFAEAVTDPGTPLQLSQIRLQRSRQLLADGMTAGGVDWETAHSVLADHYEGSFLDGPAFNAARPDFLTLCMHDSPAGFTWGNTAASVIAVPGAPTPYWWWAPTTPCTSVYLPIAVGTDPPPALGTAGSASGTGPNPELASVDGPAPGSYWWTFALLLEAVCGNPDGTRYADRQPRVREILDPLQDRFLADAAELESRGAPAEDWQHLTRRCAAAAQAAVDRLLADFAD